MIDPQLIRNDFAKVKKSLEDRKYPLHFLENYHKIDLRWRAELQELDALRNKQNTLTPKGKPISEQMEELKNLSQEIKKKKEVLQELEKEVKEAALFLPNILADDVPFGTSAENNVEIEKWGTPKEFSFKPSGHEELGQKLGLLDFEAATTIAGARFAVYRGLGAKLERSIINFMLDLHTSLGYEEIWPPALVNSTALTGTGQLPKFKDDSFKIEGTDLWLSPTAEVQLTNLYQGKIFEESELPLNLTAYTPCFRKEAGSYGKDVKGIIRQHQFNKVELVKLVKPETSFQELEVLLNNAKNVLKELELPFRIVKLCSADTGFCSAKTYDIEVWFPSQHCYREISSCSNFLDFQARRAMLRYRNKETKKVNYLHTLNGSGLAVGRTFAAILENYQDNNGNIIIPEKLKKYLGIDKI